MWKPHFGPVEPHDASVEKPGSLPMRGDDLAKLGSVFFGGGCEGPLRSSCEKKTKKRKGVVVLWRLVKAGRTSLGDQNREHTPKSVCADV